MNSENNSSFSSSIPNLQIAWDSTSLGTFKECPRKYFYTMILGRTSHAENVHLVFGAHYHAALERYDHGRSAGMDHEAALHVAVRYCYEATVKRLPGGKFVPWNSDDKNKNRWTLMRSVVWYLEQFKNDPLRTIQLDNGKPAVELSFRYETNFSAPDGQPFVICGHIDRLVEYSGSIYFLDRKTSKNAIGEDFFKKFSPDNQMSLYDFSGNVIWKEGVKGGILDAAQVMVTFSRYQRGFLRRTPKQREEWYQDAAWWINLAADCAVENNWPMNDKSCGNYGGCPFREICAKGPETRMQWLNGMTVERKWDPLVVRGDV